METAQAYFLVVVQEKSLKKAAQRLFLSPQNLGNHMKRLEDRYGPLFVRRPRFTLTAVGQALAESLWEIRNIEQEFAQRAAQLSQTPQGELRMGLNSSRAQVLLPRLVPTFRQQFPEVTLDFVYGDTQVLEQQLLEGELDLVLGGGCPGAGPAGTAAAFGGAYFVCLGGRTGGENRGQGKAGIDT